MHIVPGVCMGKTASIAGAVSKVTVQCSISRAVFTVTRQPIAGAVSKVACSVQHHMQC